VVSHDDVQVARARECFSNGFQECGSVSVLIEQGMAVFVWVNARCGCLKQVAAMNEM